jgi:hypothetical protein
MDCMYNEDLRYHKTDYLEKKNIINKLW